MEIKRTFVTPFPSTKHADKVVARVAAPNIGRFLCFFDKHAEQPAIDKEIEVMIVGLMWPRDERGYFDRNSMPKFLIVKPVTDDHVLVPHQGFDTRGSMCSTTATVSRSFDVNKIGGVNTLTPGRLNGEIREAGNMGRSFYNKPLLPEIPGFAYVSLSYINTKKGSGLTRIEGVPNLEQLAFPFNTKADRAA